MAGKKGKRRPGLLHRLRDEITGAVKVGPDAGELRGSQRADLPMTVRLEVGERGPEPRRLRNASLTGVFVEGEPIGVLGGPVKLHFDGYPEVCEPFILTGRIVRLEEESPGLAIEFERGEEAHDALESYRKLMLHYMHHRPLLDEVAKGYLEGKCGACGWIGRVGALSPRCPKCGGLVAPVQKD